VLELALLLLGATLIFPAVGDLWQSFTVAVGSIGGGAVPSVWMLLLLLVLLLSFSFLSFRDRCHRVSFALLRCYFHTTV